STSAVPSSYFFSASFAVSSGRVAWSVLGVTCPRVRPPRPAPAAGASPPRGDFGTHFRKRESERGPIPLREPLADWGGAPPCNLRVQPARTGCAPTRGRSAHRSSFSSQSDTRGLSDERGCSAGLQVIRTSEDELGTPCSTSSISTGFSRPARRGSYEGMG